MKVALILPPITLEERYNKAIVHVAGSLPPLGLLSIATVLKNAGHEVIVLDGTMLSHAEIMLKIEGFQPQILGITAMTIMWQKAKILILELKKRWPALNIIVGGVHASIIREKALLEIPDIDAVAWGEGEFSMLEYVGHCARGESARPIDGIAFRTKDAIVVGKDREPIKDLDTLPVPDRSFIPVQKYIGAFEQYRRLPVTNMVTTRGCPFKCLFCLPNLLGSGVRYRSVEKVIEEIKYLILNFGIRDIAFLDDTFTLNRNRVLSLCEHIIKEKLPFIWSAQGRADCVTAEMLEQMAAAGCWKIFYGVESLVQKNLDTLKKGETVEQIFEAVKLTQKFGIEVEGSFIFGIPGETYQEGRKTIELSKKLGPDYAKFFCLLPYGQFLAEIDKYGTMVSDVEQDFTGSAVLFVPYSMTKDQLNELYHMSYLEFYLRPKMIYSKLKKILNPMEFSKSVRGLLVLAIFFINELKRRFRKGNH
jgi:anaerobic magnesium-protoporphyrin IX monomethyl ester cyclase